jgi:hypothetical protein
MKSRTSRSRAASSSSKEGANQAIGKTGAKTAASPGTESKWQRLAPCIFLKGLPCQTTDDIAFLRKAPLPGFFAGQRSKDLRRNGVLLILWEHDNLFQCFLEQRRHVSILSANTRACGAAHPTSRTQYTSPARAVNIADGSKSLKGSISPNPGGSSNYNRLRGVRGTDLGLHPTPLIENGLDLDETVTTHH